MDETDLARRSIDETRGRLALIVRELSHRTSLSYARERARERAIDQVRTASRHVQTHPVPYLVTLLTAGALILGLVRWSMKSRTKRRRLALAYRKPA
jgi:hypothetical protein